MSDRMTILGKDGRIRYIVEDDEVVNVKDCKHWFFDKDLPCIYCNVYQDELEVIKDNNGNIN